MKGKAKRKGPPSKTKIPRGKSKGRLPDPEAPTAFKRIGLSPAIPHSKRYGR